MARSAWSVWVAYRTPRSGALGMGYSGYHADGFAE